MRKILVSVLFGLFFLTIIFAAQTNSSSLVSKIEQTAVAKHNSRQTRKKTKKKTIAKEFIIDDFQKGVNYDNWWFGSGTYGHVYIKPVPYEGNNLVCEIDYSYNTINDDRIWLSLNKMLSINNINDYDVLHIRVISGGYGGEFILNLVDSANHYWTYVNKEILTHKQDVELNIPLHRFLCPIDLSNISIIEIGVAYGGNLYKIPYSGKCWIDDLKFIKYNK